MSNSREELNKKSNCTIGLLAIAAQAAYRVKENDTINPDGKSYSQTLNDINSHGYTISHAVSPDGTGKTPLAAVCLQPKDDKSPLIVSFRGTKTGGDVVSDLGLGTIGVVEEAFRYAAYQFYQDVRTQNPGREIILTGHSLGGHLAQYVASKAYNTHSESISNASLQVRTFNTAPINTTHNAVFAAHPGLLSQFVNYRLSSDVISDLPLREYYGNTYVFPCPQNMLQAHQMGSVINGLPKAILKQQVGGDSQLEKKHHLLIEMLNGIEKSYQCRVEGQYFSQYRAGADNLRAIKSAFPAILTAIEAKDYQGAINQLNTLEGSLNGIVSKDMINILKDSTVAVMNTPQVSTQVSMKSALKDMRNKAEEKIQVEALSQSGSTPTM